LNRHFIYDPQNESDSLEYTKLKELCECLTVKRNLRDKGVVIKETTEKNGYRSKWLSLIRELWGDKLVLSIIHPIPSNTKVLNTLDGFGFICKTIAEYIYERLCFSMPYLRVLVRKEGPGTSNEYSQSPLSIISINGEI
jgi:hypothetical protein